MEVIEPRAGYSGVELRQPEFVWYGDAVDRVPADGRRQLEDLIRKTLEREVLRSGIVRAARRGADARIPLIDAAVERFDESLGSDILGLYMLASYDGQGKKKPVPVDKKAEPTEPVENAITVDIFRILDSDWASRVSKSELIDIERKLFDDWDMIYPEGGPVGLIWVHNDNEWPIRFYVRNLPGDEWSYFSFSRFTSKELSVEGNVASFKWRKPYVPPAGPSAAEWLPIDEVKARIRARISEDAWTIKKPDSMEQEVFNEKIRSLIEAEFTERTKAAAGHTDVMVLYIGGDFEYLLFPSERLRWSGMIPLAPMSEPHVIKKPKKGDEGGGGVGDAQGTEGEGKEGKGKKKGGKDGKEGGKGEPGGFVFMGDEENAKKGGSAGIPSAGDGESVSCEEPFVGEPSLDELDAPAREGLKKLMEEIAHKLQIPMCNYAGQFCLMAAYALGGRAVGLSEFAVSSGNGKMLIPPKHKEAQGAVIDFTPTATPAIQFMRHLSGVTPRITFLSRLIGEVYQMPQHAAKIKGRRHNHAIGWMIDFGSEMHWTMKKSVANVFVVTVRIILMQMLHTSKLNIDARLNEQNFERYAQFFTELVKSELVPQQELEDLYNTLRLFVSTGSVKRDIAETVLGTWRAGRGALLDALEWRNPFKNVMAGTPGTIVFGDNQVTGIQDSKGTIWTLQQLERAKALRGQVAVDIDPLAQQLVADARIKERFTRDTDNIKSELKKLLEEMSSNNSEISDKVRSDIGFAFSLAPLRTNNSNRTGYELEGVHLMAQEAIQEFFQGDSYYHFGVRSAMRREEGRRDFLNIIEIGSIVVLSILCPPLGMAVGGAWAIYHEHKAHEKLKVYQSLIDPERVLHYAEVEADLFAADLGLVLSFLPMGKVAGKVGMGAGKKLLQGEVAAAGRYVARQVSRRFVISTLRALQQDLIVAFITHMVAFEVVGKAFEVLLSPVMEEIQRQHFTIAQLEELAAEVQQV